MDLTAAVSGGYVQEVQRCPKRGDLLLAMPKVDLLSGDQLPQPDSPITGAAGDSAGSAALIATAHTWSVWLASSCSQRPEVRSHTRAV